MLQIAILALALRDPESARELAESLQSMVIAKSLRAPFAQALAGQTKVSAVFKNEAPAESRGIFWF